MLQFPVTQRSAPAFKCWLNNGPVQMAVVESSVFMLSAVGVLRIFC